MHAVYSGRSRMCVPMPGNQSGADIITLMPGLNVMDDKAWKYCLSRLKPLLNRGVLKKVTEKSARGQSRNVAHRVSKST